MKFVNNTIHKEIDQAIKLAESLLNIESPMIDSVRDKDDWKYNSGGSIAIASNLLKEHSPIQVYTYKPKLPWSKAIGYFDGKAIHINSRKLPFMTTVEIASNLIHEYAHCCGYSHGSNFKTDFKCKYSVPYFLSSNVEKWI
jgi:hypothetical protein